MLKLSLSLTEKDESFYVETNTQDTILIQIKKNKECWSKVILIEQLESMDYWNKLTFENIFNLIKINLKHKLHEIREEDEEIFITFKLNENYSFPEITLLQDINGSNEVENELENHTIKRMMKKRNRFNLGRKIEQSQEQILNSDPKQEYLNSPNPVRKKKIEISAFINYNDERKKQLKNLNFSEIAKKIIIRKEWNSMTLEQKKKYSDVY
jgi:hypothetical protein